MLGSTYFCKEAVASCTIKTIAVVYFDKQMFASQNHALESIYEIAVASNLDKTSLILLINSYLFPELIHCPEAEFEPGSLASQSNTNMPWYAGPFNSNFVTKSKTSIFESDNETGTGMKLATQRSLCTKNCQIGLLGLDL